MKLRRVAGLAVGLGSMVRTVWAGRYGSSFPVWELFRRELGTPSFVRGGAGVCAVAGVLLVIAPVSWMLSADTHSLTLDRRVLDGARSRSR